MKAFILAAGLGTRLRPITNDIPKCLVEINDKPLLSIWLELLEKHGVTEVLINTHYKSEKVDHFLLSYNGTIKITSIYEDQLLGSAGTLRENRNFIESNDPFFIIYADNLTNINLSSMMKFYQQNPATLLMALFHASIPQNCGIAVLGERHIISDFVEKPKNPVSNLANAGIYIANRELFNYLPLDNPSDLGHDVLPNLKGIMHGYPFDEYLLDIGTLEAYKRAQEDWKS